MANWAHFALVLALLQPLASGGSGLLELRGKVILPPGYRDRIAQVTVSSLNSPYFTQRAFFHNSTFKFSKLEPGPYMVAVSVRGIGELKQTIDVSPIRADPRGRVMVELRMESGEVSSPPGAGRIVSVRQLSIPGKAKAFYSRALERLAKKDVGSAIPLLEKAVTEAPQFAEALNTLGTIYNQRRNYQKAEEYFREALRQSPGSYSPTVNLGGVLLAQGRLPEALSYNQRAVEARPNDALARGQLGWAFLELGQAEEALIHLQEAKRLDPGNLIGAQLGLAEIYAQRSELGKAATELEEYVRLHPNDPDAARMRAEVSRLRNEAK